MFLMGIIGLVIRALSLLALYLISSPKKLRLLPPERNEIQKPETAKPLTDQLHPSQPQSVDNSAMVNSR